MSDVLCEQEPEMMNIYLGYVVPTLFLLSAIVGGVYTTLFINAYRQHKLEINRYIFGFAVLFFIITLLNYVSWTIGAFTRCNNPSVNAVFAPISTILYMSKGLILVGILFTTVRIAFNGTPFAISRCAVLCFRIPFVLSCVFVAATVIIIAVHDSTMGYMIGGATNLVSSALSIYLVVLFIHKLLSTYRCLEIATDNAKDEKLVCIITKIALLFSISTVTRILVPVVLAGSSSSSFISVHFKLFVYVWIAIDLHTNFFCILLCFQHFDAVYMRLCGICDRCCRCCWMRCVHTGDEKMMMKEAEVRNVAVQSGSTLPRAELELRNNTTKSEMSDVNSAREQSQP